MAKRSTVATSAVSAAFASMNLDQMRLVVVFGGFHPDLEKKKRAEKNKTGGQWRKSARRWVLAELC